jgi:hypothetical protein
MVDAKIIPTYNNYLCSPPAIITVLLVATAPEPVKDVVQSTMQFVLAKYLEDWLLLQLLGLRPRPYNLETSADQNQLVHPPRPDQVLCRYRLDPSDQQVDLNQ